jgi:hypothetical protein
MDWRKSTYSDANGGDCVEVGQVAGAVAVRDTKRHGEGPELSFGADAWQVFVEKVTNS